MQVTEIPKDHFLYVAQKLDDMAHKLANGDVEIAMSALVACLVMNAQDEGIPLATVIQNVVAAHAELCEAVDEDEDDIVPQEKDAGGTFVWLKKPDEDARKVYVHDIMCETFNGPRPSPEHVVKHLDGDIYNNKATNLAWTK
jgi:hypothetical protein